MPGKTSLLDAIQFAIGANRRLLGKEDIGLLRTRLMYRKDDMQSSIYLLRPVDDERQ